MTMFQYLTNEIVMINVIRKIRWLYLCALWKDVYDTIDISIIASKLWNDWADRVVYDNLLSNKSIIYSFWIWTDISFDLSVISKKKCIIKAFDPTMRSITRLESQELPQWFLYFKRWVSWKTWTQKFYKPKNDLFISHSTCNSSEFKDDYDIITVKTVYDIMCELWDDYIDCAKFDIEWSEYDAVEKMIYDWIFPKQVLIEVHHRFTWINISKTKELNILMRTAWYKLFSLSQNWQEYSWVHWTVV